MPGLNRSRLFGLAGFVMLLSVTACTSGTGVTLQTPPSSSSTDSPILSDSSTAVTTPTGASSRPTTTVQPTTATQSSRSSSMSPAEREASDRKAIEAAWVKYWAVGAQAIGLPVPQQKALMSTVAVDPALSLVLAGYAKFAKNGWTDYGTPTHRPYWKTPVGGKPTAVMGDCMDDSKAGSMDIKTGRKLTVGVPRDNTRITMIKTTAGVWRVSKVEYLVDQPC